MLQTESMTIKASRKILARLDDIAASLDRSRNYVIHKALENFIETQNWQTARIRAGLKAARKGKTIDADEVFERIGKKHGWKK